MSDSQEVRSPKQNPWIVRHLNDVRRASAGVLSKTVLQRPSDDQDQIKLSDQSAFSFDQSEIANADGNQLSETNERSKIVSDRPDDIPTTGRDAEKSSQNAIDHHDDDDDDDDRSSTISESSDDSGTSSSSGSIKCYTFHHDDVTDEKPTAIDQSSARKDDETKKETIPISCIEIDTITVAAKQSTMADVQYGEGYVKKLRSFFSSLSNQPDRSTSISRQKPIVIPTGESDRQESSAETKSAKQQSVSVQEMLTETDAVIDQIRSAVPVWVEPVRNDPPVALVSLAKATNRSVINTNTDSIDYPELLMPMPAPRRSSILLLESIPETVEPETDGSVETKSITAIDDSSMRNGVQIDRIEPKPKPILEPIERQSVNDPKKNNHQKSMTNVRKVQQADDSALNEMRKLLEKFQQRRRYENFDDLRQISAQVPVY